jgi:cytidylate kinase
MNAITVTRDYGAGGYEVARLLAEELGWELLDRELLHQAAAVEHLPEEELERLDEKAVPLADRFRLHPPHEHYLHGLREAARQAAARGQVVLVGRGTGQLLADHPDVFHLRLVAPREWRAARMAQREGRSQEEALAKCTQEDRSRERFTRYFFGEAPFEPARYHAIFNTARVALADVAGCVGSLLRDPAGAQATTEAPAASAQSRVLTLSRELGAGEASFAAPLAARLGLTVHDRDLLEQEATRLSVTKEELGKIDEHPASLFQRLLPGSLYHRYFAVLGQIVHDLAAGGNALVVGRGGHRFLADWPGAFHVRIVAPLELRVRRVMEHRWVREGVARQLIAESDAMRRRFCEGCFGTDWADPLRYHLAVNTGWLGPAAVDLVALVAGRVWATR